MGREGQGQKEWEPGTEVDHYTRCAYGRGHVKWAQRCRHRHGRCSSSLFLPPAPPSPLPAAAASHSALAMQFARIIVHCALPCCGPLVLRDLTWVQSPRDKLVSILNCCKVINNLLAARKYGAGARARARPARRGRLQAAAARLVQGPALHGCGCLFGLSHVTDDDGGR